MLGTTCVQVMPFLAFILCLCAVKAEEEVVISQGKIRGTTLAARNGRKFSAFLGIPYAKPPIGALRFRNPLPADSWNGTLVADAEANQCPQYGEDGTPVGYEDCLYLNVYTPELNPKVLYPTMVYIHGGAFVKGSARTVDVAPGFFMDRDIVLVAMNYRLGVLGFLSTGDVEASGNFGLKDQVSALRWVKENVEKFGGDPNKVTLFGESAGSASVNLHVLSEASDGLFNRYITQSGSPLCFWAYHDISSYKKHATDLGAYVSCPTNNSRVLIECLRRIDVYTLVDTNNIFNSFTRSIQAWLPTNEPEIDGAFLTTSPMDRILKNKVKDYPWIAGVVADEGLVVTQQFYRNNTLYEMISTDIEKFLENAIGMINNVDNPEQVASSVKDFYFKGVDPSNKDAYRGTYSATMKFTNQSIGVSHADDLIYLFPSRPEAFGVSEIKFSQSDELMIDVMVDLWTSFAADGIPTTNRTGNPKIWHPYNETTSYLQIGRASEPSLSLENHFHEDRMHFWAMQLLKMAFKMG